MDYQKELKRAIILAIVLGMETIFFFSTGMLATLGYITAVFTVLCFLAAILFYSLQKDAEKAKEERERKQQEELKLQLLREEEERIKKEKAAKLQKQKAEKRKKEEEERNKKAEEQKREQEKIEAQKQKEYEQIKELSKKQKAEIIEEQEISEDMVKRVQDIEELKQRIFGNPYFIQIVKPMIKQGQINQFVAQLEEVKDKKYERCASGEKTRTKRWLGDFWQDEMFVPSNTVQAPEPKLILMGLLYYQKILDLIQKDKELTAICQNLWKTYQENEYINLEYISKKAYDIYRNSYQKEYHLSITQKDFEIVFRFLPKEETRKQENDLYASLFLKEYKTAEEFPNKIYEQLIFHRKSKSFYINSYLLWMAENQANFSIFEICEMLVGMDEKIERYMEMVKEEKAKIKKQKEKEEKKKQGKKAKEKLEQERMRLIQGDISKENELNAEILKKKQKKKELELGYQDVENGYEFEEYVAKLYQRLGFETTVTRKSGDQGADIIAKRNGRKYIIQAKFYNSPVGNKAVQEVVAALAMYQADYGIVVTNSTYTQSAIELAKANDVELIDKKRIEEIKRELISSLGVN